MSIKTVLDGMNESSEIGLLATLRGRRERTLVSSCPFLSSNLLFHKGFLALLSRPIIIFGKRCGWFSSNRDNALNGEGIDGRAYIANGRGLRGRNGDCGCAVVREWGDKRAIETIFCDDCCAKNLVACDIMKTRVSGWDIG